ncbi:hypothetical protein B0J17DRAFT_722495 [Rhizoctonia solani]|nr:hypothetical protein B0J17DRAFT_722495 [Rhizoctonia solani]
MAAVLGARVDSGSMHLGTSGAALAFILSFLTGRKYYGRAQPTREATIGNYYELSRGGFASIRNLRWCAGRYYI